ncbi:MAG: hypothetical protein H6601_05115 [Flavobacteriales bacterium]|nr:hypothetical protein [Flavobacteriales bacterium]
MAFGITTIFKKKVAEEKVAELFVNIAFNAVDNSFAEVAELLSNDVNLLRPAKIDPENQDDFLLIVIAGNFKLLDEYFHEGQEDRIKELTIEKLSSVYGVDTVSMRTAIDNMLAYFGKINYPSKNTHYAMSRAVFFKYGLNDFQKDYFRNLNTPDPILLKNIDEIMEQFIIKWDTFTEKYRITD